MARLQAVVIGNSASMLNGAPVTTQNIDLLIRDTKLNRRKLVRFAKAIDGLAVRVDVHYDRISGDLTVSSVRSRSELVDLGSEKLTVAALADVVRSKEAANRPKDRAVLPILRDTLAVKVKLER